jgi:DNA-binding MarR family transcriptional regulator
METVRLADELMGVMTSVRRVVRRRLRADLPVPPLRGAQVELLHVVGEQPGIGVAAAAARLHLADNSVSTLVNQLVAGGLLSRGTDPGDRRVARLELTDVAKARLGEWRDRRARLVGDRLAELPDTDREAIAAALPALNRLLTILTEA